MSASPHSPSHKGTLPLAISALGVVYGDIGTSPLYAYRECVAEAGMPLPTSHVLGAASLICWALIGLVSVKYLVLVLRADHEGEGGILALMTLATRHAKRTAVLGALGVFGAALLYGDGMLTPAITVLGAMEGLKEAWPEATHWVVPATLVVLAGLFAAQKLGTGRVGAVFGPVMVVWFVTLGVLGAISIGQTPEVLKAMNPLYAARYLFQGSWHSFAVLGSVFLAVTGAEALYADLGHFGAAPIRRAWTWIAFPGLALTYLGQAALVLRDPTAAQNPFYRLAPPEFQWPLLILATLAGIVASQALISGAFSLTMQAMQLGLLPRVSIQHTSASHRGQIYVGVVNAGLAVGCIALVLAFRSSNALAAAYGIAVSLTMVVTTLFLAVIARDQWSWPVWKLIVVVGSFFVIDLTFLGANLLKIHDGGWLPLVLGSGLFLVMTTWRRGRELLGRRLRARQVPLEEFVAQIQTSSSVKRVSGTAVFLSGSPEGTPVALLHNLKHNRVVHERVLVLRFSTVNRPHVPEAERVAIHPLPAGFWRVTASFGFMEEPSLEIVREACRTQNLEWQDLATTYFLGRETILPARHPILPRWRAWLFRLLARNAQQPTAFFRLPPNRVVELGVQVEI